MKVQGGKKATKVVNMMRITKQVAHKQTNKCARFNFVSTWSIANVNETCDCFQNNFQVGLKTNPLGYTSVNFGFTTMVQREARQ